MTKDKGNGGFSGEGNLPANTLVPEFETAAAPIFAVDVEKYRAWLDEADLTPAQEAEVLEALWSIVVMFVELGFGVHPLQEVYDEDQSDENRLVNKDSNTLDSEKLDNF